MKYLWNYLLMIFAPKHYAKKRQAFINSHWGNK